MRPIRFSGPGGPLDTDARPRTALSGESAELVSLTPLAARAVRARLVAEGRHAPLIGELAEAEPAGLLGLSLRALPLGGRESGIDRMAVRGGRESGLPILLDAVRRGPFRTRAMLDVLVQALPAAGAVQLGPLAEQLLVDNGEFSLEELGEQEALHAITEHLVHLLETGGPDALAPIPAAEAPPPDCESACLRPSRRGWPGTRPCVHWPEFPVLRRRPPNKRR
ncbi:hypothetical protein G3I59_11410 [Amycolatopsis rubida]|uniref:Uncharacterized protein n=1 Tax=Amycolatopsis rubida TaxID=112413 RepID=A0ABX0BP40_9PSEU|nr:MULTISPECIES: hypothetical protein [Amycolatopsis]MYW91195.1 hypothetical protein [Amycolatopsis rubida]NEC56180.1 hypothetical protein [Amycolatopsis rubida]OAP21046.1 hypothetical protein A4R44_08258 [Amycolatopsis sp. M39]